MAVNKNALLRYKTIDKCLQNHFKTWTLNDLIEACSDALYDYEGKDVDVSKRTIQLDLQMMRSDKLGYNAPIIVYDRKFYKYEDENYSITNSPISNQDLNKLSEAVSFLKQFQGFSHFSALDSMVQKLEDHVYTQKTQEKALIDFEKNDNLKGFNFLDELYRYIQVKKPIKLTYKSFKAREKSTFTFHPYLLKEFRNRWFIIGRKNSNVALLNLALDRIVKIEESADEFIYNTTFNLENYYKNVIGVSVSPTIKTEHILLYVTHKHAPYVVTKPFHSSQKIVDKDNYGITISLDVQHNFELEKEILSLGDGIKVLAPKRLKETIKERLQESVDTYNTELDLKELTLLKKQVLHKGFSVLNQVYTKREIKKIKGKLHMYLKNNPGKTYSLREVFLRLPQLKPLVINKNLKQIIDSLLPNAFLTKVIYFDKTIQDNWYVTWHQDLPVNVKDKIETDGFTSWTKKEDVISVIPPEAINKNTISIRVHLDNTNSENGALKVIPGSQNKRLTDTEIKLIIDNSLPFDCEVNLGGIHILKPQILHASSKNKSGKRRRVLHLEFSNLDLPNGLEYAEKVDL
ncbi:phytanoyl-CoA dioxygenase family protein [Aurantibacter aestuarii]|uniref:Phytanoyl-CoA dioxygenase n=1 Tax=Aurantibacter aestuarii TaxID=1266046 RepID=A0A2T1ND41_9FLAO|nr:WYL domain-containing protein [Aurantibacter aestuarii]PSG90351.1 phytanoyl-CoA dioxygenase [Aurantibacter aestuarii]